MRLELLWASLDVSDIVIASEAALLTAPSRAGKQIAEALQQCASDEVALEPAAWQSMLAAVDADSEDAVDWAKLAKFLGDVAKHILREQMLHELQARAGHAAEEDSAI